MPETNEVAPKRGMRFLHARQIAKDSSARNPVPEECEVTRVTAGAVYYRNSTGFRTYAVPARFPEIVKEWLPTTAPHPAEMVADPNAKEAQ
jgi:hypothetical protein